jgi:hypothetical protein
MADADGGCDGLGPQRLATNPIRHGGLIMPAHDEIELAHRKQRKKLLGTSVMDPDAQVGTGMPHPREHGGKHPGGRDRGRADPGYQA